MCSSTTQGFKVLAIRFSSQNTSSHCLYIKEHSVRHHDEDKPAGRSLFILNVPPYATEHSLKTAFSEVGGISNVILQETATEDQKNNGFKVAYLIFQKRDNLLKALKLSSLNYLSTTENPVKTGIAKWVHQYNSTFCNIEELSSEINTFMDNYDEEEKKQTEKDEVDDEGWTVVTKKGRNPGVARKESVDLKIQEKIQKGTKKKELKNFYTFQIRESKMKNIANLRKNYEEAKNKVTAMKNARRFKPY